MLKKTLVITLKIGVLALFLAILVAVVSAWVLPPTPLDPDEAATSLVWLLVVSLVETLVLSFIILRSYWHGWKLAGAIIFVSFGVRTFMTQIETAVFVTTLPEGFVPRLFLAGAITAAVYAVVAVFVLDKWKSREAASRKLSFSPGGWGWRVAVVALMYMALYLLFGYFIAWKNPELRAFYGGVDPGSFMGQLGNIMRDTPWLPGFQLVRALVWIGLALPVIWMMRDRWWMVAGSVGALFAVLMNAQLLLPNPFMPEGVRMTHLVETASSNFIFGVFLVWMLLDRKEENGSSRKVKAKETAPIAIEPTGPSMHAQKGVMEAILLLGFLMSNVQICLGQTAETRLIEGKTILQEGVNRSDTTMINMARALFEQVRTGDDLAYLGHYYSALADYRHLNLEKDDDRAEQHLERAITALEQARSLAPEFADGLALLSSLYARKAGMNPLKAISLGPKSKGLIDQALALEPDNPRVVLFKGISDYYTPKMFGGSKEKGREGFARAVQLFEQQVASETLHPRWGHEDALTWLGIAYRDEGNPAQARHCFEKALEVNPEFGWVSENLLPALEAKHGEN